MDDEFVTSTTDYVHPVTSKGIKGIKDIFLNNYVNDGKQSYSYRPITTLSFAIETDLSKSIDNKAKVSHLISLLLYITCCFLIIRVTTKFSNLSPYLRAFIVIFFLIHPIHTEVLNNIKCRDEILALLFGLLSVNELFKYEESKKKIHLLFSVLFIILGILSKPSALPFIVLTPLTVYWSKGIKLISKWRIFLIFTSSYILNLLFRNGIKNQVTTRNFEFIENPLFTTTEYGSKIEFTLSSFVFYIKKFFIPIEQVFYYGFESIYINRYSSISFYLYLFSIITLLICLFYFRKKNFLISFGLTFFFLGIFGATNLLQPFPGIVAERTLFIPSLGLCIFVTGILQEINLRYFHQKSSVIILSTLTLLTLSSFLIVNNRNRDWSSKEKLYLTDYYKEPKSVKINLFNAQIHENRFYKHLKKQGFHNYNSLIEQGDSAELFYYNALNTYPNHKTTLNNLASLILLKNQNFIDALQYSSKAIKQDSSDYEIIFNRLKMYNEISKNCSNFSDIFTESSFYYLKNKNEDFTAIYRINTIKPNLSKLLNENQWNLCYKYISSLKRLELNESLFENKFYSGLLKLINQKAKPNDFFNFFSEQEKIYLDQIRELNINDGKPNIKSDINRTIELYIIQNGVDIQLEKTTTKTLLKLNLYQETIDWNKYFLKNSYANQKRNKTHLNIARAYKMIDDTTNTKLHLDSARVTPLNNKQKKQ